MKHVLKKKNDNNGPLEKLMGHLAQIDPNFLIDYFREIHRPVASFTKEVNPD